MKQIAKAIAGLITPLVMIPLLYIGITPDTVVSDAVDIAVMAIVTGLFSFTTVYFTPNKK